MSGLGFQQRKRRPGQVGATRGREEGKEEATMATAAGSGETHGSQEEEGNARGEEKACGQRMCGRGEEDVRGEEEQCCRREASV